MPTTSEIFIKINAKPDDGNSRNVLCSLNLIWMLIC